METIKPANLPPLFLNFDTANEPGYRRVALLTLYDFFEWWYIKMPIFLNRYVNRVTEVAFDRLSISLLLRTFFVPWHRDRSAVGHGMGIAIRLLYLPIALTIALSTVIVGYSVIFGWILLPILSILFVFLTPFIS